jgi:adhesin transport system outer membrane protein
MRRASLPAQESPALIATEEQTRDQMEESELIAYARRVAEAALVVEFERFEQERREADGRASLAAPEQTVVAGTQQTFLEELGSSIEQARQAVEAAEAAEATEVAEVAEVAEAAAQLEAFEQFEQERRDADRLDEVQRPREWERARQPVIELPNCVVS